MIPKTKKAENLKTRHNNSRKRELAIKGEVGKIYEVEKGFTN